MVGGSPLHRRSFLAAIAGAGANALLPAAEQQQPPHSDLALIALMKSAANEVRGLANRIPAVARPPDLMQGIATLDAILTTPSRLAFEPKAGETFEGYMGVFPTRLATMYVNRVKTSRAKAAAVEFMTTHEIHHLAPSVRQHNASVRAEALRIRDLTASASGFDALQALYPRALKNTLDRVNYDARANRFAIANAVARAGSVENAPAHLVRLAADAADADYAELLTNAARAIESRQPDPERNLQLQLFIIGIDGALRGQLRGLAALQEVPLRDNAAFSKWCREVCSKQHL